MEKEKLEEYQNEEKALVRLANLTTEEYADNEKFCFEQQFNLEDSFADNLKKITWFIPAIKNPLAGGIRTAFMIADYMSREHDVHNYIVIDDFKEKGEKYDLEPIKKALDTNFPKLKYQLILLFRTKHPSTLPTADIGVCTLWTTAYLLAKYNKCSKKCYLIQDDESLFYPAGTLSSLINETYALGFDAIINSENVFRSLLSKQVRRHVVLQPAVDTSVFYPREKSKDYTQIVFYGRPGNERNGFILGMEILSQIKRRLGGSVKVQSVGDDWSETYNNYLDSGIECLGRLDSLEAVAKLYGESHFGLCFMMTPHPSYQPFEYMASGCIPITNHKYFADHYLHAGINCIKVPAIVDVASDLIIRTIKDKEYQEQIKSSFEVNSDWYGELKKVGEFLTTTAP